MTDPPDYGAQAVAMAQMLHLPQIIEEQPLLTIGPQNFCDKPLWKCLTVEGETLVKKSEILTSEARMMFHASRALGLKAPMLRAVSRQGQHTAMYMDFVPGRTVHSVWKKMSCSNRNLIKQQLRAEIVRMRQSTRPWIGRVDWNGDIHITDPFYDQYFPDTQSASNTMTYFRSEAEFDAYKVHKFQVHCNEQSAQQLQSLLTPLRTEYTERFVLIHADLHQENILVREVRDQSGKSRWHLAGIIDWARSGYYPEYMEYATVLKDGPYMG
jgi:Phosphotransferase enzyme family